MEIHEPMVEDLSCIYIVGRFLVVMYCLYLIKYVVDEKVNIEKKKNNGTRKLTAHRKIAHSNL